MNNLHADTKEKVRPQDYISSQEQMESRMWIDTMSSHLDDVLRNNYDKSIHDFTDVIIYEVSKITQALRGVFYVLEGNNLEAAGCYACTLKSLFKNKFQLGEGIIGQAAKGKEIIYLENLSQNNLEVSASSGIIQATSVIAIPLLFNENLFGIIELLYIDNLEEKYKELLKKLGKNIATMLQSIQGNIKTRLLLEETTQQAGILQTIEEELRQNMEELQTTQEEMQRINKEMLLLNNAVEESLFVVEIAPNGNLIRACNLFLEYTGYESKELINMNYSTLFAAEEEEPFFKNMLVLLREGKIVTKEVQRKKKNGEQFWLYATYYAIMNDNGIVKKIVKFAYDITERIENQKFVEANEKLLKERTKTVQDKAYKQIKEIKAKYEEQLAEKDAIIAELKNNRIGY